ncbi:MAG: hypothetical protein KA184_08370 [Candidatus Hydrogenedentes bacterium]|nr:hypothetical protein [Candidatus Hydrogenedentota bacterium]
MEHAWMMKRLLGLQLALALTGAVANSLFNGSWKAPASLVYDVPASMVTFGFIAQVLIELFREGPRGYTVLRLVMFLAMFAVTAGRQFLGWSISGHLSCALAVALVQAADPRLFLTERVLYCVPVPIVLYFRWTAGDYNTPSGDANHWQTYNAVLFALAWAVPVIAAGRLTKYS